MVGLPRRRPRLAKVAGIALDAGDAEADRYPGREIEVDRPVAIGHADRQQRQDAVLFAAAEPAIGDAVDLGERNAAQGPLEPSRLFSALPAEAVGDQHEPARVAVE